MARQSEKSILNETLVALSALPETLVYRNNTGMAWTGKKVDAVVGQLVRVKPGTVILENARPIRFGLPGSGDIMGATSGRPLAVETKDAIGKQRESQELFERAWVRAGGIYILARSADEAREKTLRALSA